MKNVKNMFMLVISVVAVFSAQSSMAEISFNARNFVSDSKKQGTAYYFERGNVRQDWLAKAVNVVTSRLSDRNKDNVIRSVIEMADTLIGVPLRNNQNISDAQYNSIMANVKRTIEDYVNRNAVPY